MSVIARARRAPASSLVALNYGAQALTLVSGVLLARGLTVQDRGSFAIYLSVLTLSAQLLNAPLAELAIVRFRAWIPLIERDARSRVVAVLAWIGGATLLTLVTTSTAAGFVPFWFVPSYLAFNLVSSIASARVISDGRVLTFGLLKVVNILSVILGIAATTSLVADKSDRLLASAGVFVLTEAITALAAWSFARGRQNGATATARNSASSPAWRLLTAALVTGVLGQSYDRLLLLAGSTLASAIELAHVAVALSTLAPITVVGSALVPLKLANYTSNSQPARPSASSAAGVRLALGIAGGLICYLALLVVLVPLVFGEDYAEAADYAWALSLGCILLVVGRLRSASLRSGGRPGSAIKCEVLSSAAFGVAWVCVSVMRLSPVVSLATMWFVVGATLAWLTTSSLKELPLRVGGAND